MRATGILLAGTLLMGMLGGCEPAEEGTQAQPFASYQVVPVDLDSFFVGMEGAFVLAEPMSGRLRVYNPERANTRYLPASTFKIANTLIALETGVVDGKGFPLPWDTVAAPSSRYGPRSWRQDQTLETAFRNSVYWYYQEVARRIGEAPMREHLAQFAYGNQDMGGGLDRFWLQGDLRISPLEQVAFLQRLNAGNLGVTAAHTALVKELMLLEEGPGYVLRGKTGTGEVTATRELGWLVGMVEAGGSVQYYALNMEGERVWEDWPPQQRKVLVTAILRAMQVIR